MSTWGDRQPYPNRHGAQNSHLGYNELSMSKTKKKLPSYSTHQTDSAYQHAATPIRRGPTSEHFGSAPVNVLSIPKLAVGVGWLRSGHKLGRWSPFMAQLVGNLALRTWSFDQGLRSI
jgi:hypothetical protein